MQTTQVCVPRDDYFDRAKFHCFYDNHMLYIFKKRQDKFYYKIILDKIFKVNIYFECNFNRMVRIDHSLYMIAPKQKYVKANQFELVLDMCMYHLEHDKWYKYDSKNVHLAQPVLSCGAFQFVEYFDTILQHVCIACCNNNGAVAFDIVTREWHLLNASQAYLEDNAMYVYCADRQSLAQVVEHPMYFATVNVSPTMSQLKEQNANYFAVKQVYAPCFLDQVPHVMYCAHGLVALICTMDTVPQLLVIDTHLQHVVWKRELVANVMGAAYHKGRFFIVTDQKWMVLTCDAIADERQVLLEFLKSKWQTDLKICYS